MRVLGIETSCDETGVALFDTERGELRVSPERLEAGLKMLAELVDKKYLPRKEFQRVVERSALQNQGLALSQCVERQRWRPNGKRRRGRAGQ